MKGKSIVVFQKKKTFISGLFTSYYSKCHNIEEITNSVTKTSYSILLFPNLNVVLMRFRHHSRWKQSFRWTPDVRGTISHISQRSISFNFIHISPFTMFVLENLRTGDKSNQLFQGFPTLHSKLRIFYANLVFNQPHRK